MITGTEALEAERDAVFLHGLPTRVKHLESVVDTMHRDSQVMQATMAGLAQQVTGVADTLKDFGTKLDAQRTRRPDWSTLAAWAGVLLVVGAMAFVPIREQQASMRLEMTAAAKVHVEDAYKMGHYAARLEALERMENRTWGECTK